MNKNFKFIIFSVLLSLSFVLSGCQQDAQLSGGNKEKLSASENAPSSENPKKDESKAYVSPLTQDDLSLLSKSYDQLSLTERFRFDEILSLYSVLNQEDKEKISENLERLKKEKENFKKTAESHYELREDDGKIYTFNPGYYGMGNNLDIPEAGSFYFVFSGKGHFKIYDRENKVYYETDIDSTKEIPKLHGFLFDGWAFESTGNLVTKIQLNQESQGISDCDLYRGVYVGGTDITPGSYKLSFQKSDYIGDHFELVLKHIEGENVVEEVRIDEHDGPTTIEIKNGDRLMIKNIQKIHLSPQ